MTGATQDKKGITIVLSDEEIAAFKIFQAIYHDVLIMHDSGVFTFKSGKAIIHRDVDGTLKRIDVELVKYKDRD